MFSQPGGLWANLVREGRVKKTGKKYKGVTKALLL